MARRAMNPHGCALPHCAPLLRRLRRFRACASATPQAAPGSPAPARAGIGFATMCI
ncbi:MAG: hypothetical protein WC978_08450 [bacterium]